MYLFLFYHGDLKAWFVWQNAIWVLMDFLLPPVDLLLEERGGKQVMFHFLYCPCPNKREKMYCNHPQGISVRAWENNKDKSKAILTERIPNGITDHPIDQIRHLHKNSVPTDFCCKNISEICQSSLMRKANTGLQWVIIILISSALWCTSVLLLSSDIPWTAMVLSIYRSRRRLADLRWPSKLQEGSSNI